MLVSFSRENIYMGLSISTRDRYPQVVSRIFGFLSYVNVYPTDLIQRIMTPMFVHNTCSGNYRYIPREYCVLDYSLRVDMPEYDGPFLKPEMRNFIAKVCREFCFLQRQ